MQTIAYQVGLLVRELENDPGIRTRMLTSSLYRFIGLFPSLLSLRGFLSFQSARRRRYWRGFFNDIKPYARRCNWWVRAAIGVAASPVAGLALFGLIYPFLLLYFSPVLVLREFRATLEKMREALSRWEGRRITVYCGHCAQEPEQGKGEADPTIITLPTGEKLDRNKGILFFLKGYSYETAYPLLDFLQREGLLDVDFCILTTSPAVASVFGRTNSRYEVHSVHGSSVIDKDEEIEIYEEVHKVFSEILPSLNQFAYKGVPIVGFMAIQYFTTAAIFAYVLKVLRSSIENNRKHFLFVSEGADTSVETILRSIWRDNQADFNEFGCYTFHPLGDECVSAPYERERMPESARAGPKGGALISERKERRLCSEIERLVSCRSLPCAAFRLYYEYRQPFFYFHSLMVNSARKMQPAPVLMVVDAHPKSIYWKAAHPVIVQMVARGVPLVVITSISSTYVQLMEEGVETLLITGQMAALPEAERFNRERSCIHMGLSSFLQFELGNVRKGDSQYFDGEKAYKLFTSLQRSGVSVPILRRSMLLIELLDRAFELYRPRSALIMPHSSPVPAHAIDVAEKHGVPSVTMPAVTVDSNRRSIPTNWATSIIASYGHQCNRAFVDTGHDENALVLTGNASMDRLLQHQVELTEEQVRERLGLAATTKIVLVATSRIDVEEYIWLNTMHEYCERRGDAAVVVKSHPSFDPSVYSAVRTGPRCMVVADIPIYSLIYSAAMVVTDYSTTGAEAALVGKPLAVVNLLGKPFPSNRYDQAGVALMIDDMDKIERVLGKLLDGDPQVIEDMRVAREEFAREYNYCNDGKAAERIADIVINPSNYIH